MGWGVSCASTLSAHACLQQVKTCEMMRSSCRAETLCGLITEGAYVDHQESHRGVERWQQEFPESSCLASPRCIRIRDQLSVAMSGAATGPFSVQANSGNLATCMAKQPAESEIAAFGW